MQLPLLWLSKLNALTLIEKHLVINHIALYIVYSKNIIKPSRGSLKITNTTNSSKILLEEFKLLYKRIVNPNYPIRQIAISFENVKNKIYKQLNLFADHEDIEKEKRVHEAIMTIQNKYGKNTILKGVNIRKKLQQKNAIHW